MAKKYDVIIIGAGPGGLFSAYELAKNNKKSIAVFDSGKALDKRKCPIDGKKVLKCVKCKSCSIMNGFGGAGAFSDGKYNITNNFGGNLFEIIGDEEALDLMNYVDEINMSFTDKKPPMYETDHSIEQLCLRNGLHLLSAKVRHLGTDINYNILDAMYKYLVSKGVEFYMDTPVKDVSHDGERTHIYTEDAEYECDNCIVSVGRSGSKWMSKICENLDIKTFSNRVDLGVRVELPYEIFSNLTDKVYECKVVYRTKLYQDAVRTFCMNPKGIVVSENTNGIITVNGHSFEDPKMQTNNTNFALLVNKHLTEPFNDSNEYGESIARLSNLLGGGVIVQRFGDLIRGQRSTHERMSKSFVKPTLKATPGDLSLVLPKRILDDIVEMIYQLDKIAPGTASDDTLLYGVETKFYNMQVDVDNNLMSKYKGLYIIGDGSGITHSLAHASASGIYVARDILK